jgi:predicted ATPase/DNA-binding SARP family transcriptional activator
MAHLLLSLLGPFQVTLGGEPVTGFATDKVRALLAYLAVEAEHPHRREALAGLLWPDWPEDSARNSLRQALFQLRQVLGDRDANAPFLLVDRKTVQFNLASDHGLDVETFTTLLLACQAHSHDSLESCELCTQRLGKAAELYKGDFLAEFFLDDSAPFEEWALLKREWLRRQALETFSHLATHYEQRGEYRQAYRYAWRQVEMDPLREEAHRKLMRALALSGQRSAALAQYETCRQALAEDLGVEPADETTVLYERIRDGELSREIGWRRSAAARLHNLPGQLTPFIGREEELAQIDDRLEDPDCRLLTLVGPGGSGKTRLALQAAAGQIGLFSHGVYLVPLAPVRSIDLLVSTIAGALDFAFQDQEDPRAQLLDYLCVREVLLVLDSFEHLIQSESTELLIDILSAAPGVKIMVTSQERLNVQGEWILEICGLKYPELGRPGLRTARGVSALRQGSPVRPSNHQDNRRAGAVPDDVEKYDAVQLFLQSARRIRGDFSLPIEAVSGVIRICQLVEGMPLGIELAAAWVQMFSCQEIAEQIEYDLDFLATSMRDVPERHRSTRAVFEHSWGRLSEEERRIFRKLSVFRGGFRKQAAELVADISLPRLFALVYKSLVRTDPSGRLEIHEILRQYAEERLQQMPDEAEQARDEHCDYYAEFLHRMEERLGGVERREALEEIGEEIENVRAGWGWAVAQGNESAIGKYVESLFLFYETRGWFHDGEEAFGRAVKRLEETGQEGSVVFWRLLARQGRMAYQIGLFEKAEELLRRSLAAFRRLDVPEEVAFCLDCLDELA